MSSAVATAPACDSVQGATATMAFLATSALWILQLTESKGSCSGSNPTLSAAIQLALRPSPQTSRRLVGGTEPRDGPGGSCAER